MRPTLLLATFLIVATTASATGQTTPPAPILVELFTSEGCSSCPPADALLARLAHEQPLPNTQIIVLGEHVDYWDQLGWHDRFSSAQLTERQNQYSVRFHLDSVYTPQMVVDGAAQFVGNDQTLAWRAVSAAAQTPKPALTLSTPAFPTLDRHRLAATLSSTAPLPPADLYAALVEPMATTEVHRGENTGRHLQHVAVVRSLTRIGSTQQLARGPVAFSLPTPAAAATLQVVVFAQQTTLSAGLGPILAAALSPTVPTTAAPTQTAAIP